jgi:hypothetical protein
LPEGTWEGESDAVGGKDSRDAVQNTDTDVAVRKAVAIKRAHWRRRFRHARKSEVCDDGEEGNPQALRI